MYPSDCFECTRSCVCVCVFEKGFAFLQYVKEEHAEKAIELFHGKQLQDGHVLQVCSLSMKRGDAVGLKYTYTIHR